MSYTQDDVAAAKGLLTMAREARNVTFRLRAEFAECDLDTARVAEALGGVHAAVGALDRAVMLLDEEHERLGNLAAVDW